MARTAVLTRQMWPIGRHRRWSTEVPRSFRVCLDGGHTVHSDVRLRRHTVVCGRPLSLEVICFGRTLKSRWASPVTAGRWVVADVTRKRSGSHESIFPPPNGL